MTLSNNGPRDANEHEIGIDEIEEALNAYDSSALNDVLVAEINDLMAAARKSAKDADNDRKLIKQPFLDGGRDVDARFKPVITRINGLVAKAKSIMTPYLQEQARVAAEAERKAREAAEAKAKAAALLANDAMVGDFVKEDAEKAAQELRIAEAQNENAGRAGSASGYARTASLRSYWDASITDAKQAAIYYADHPKVTDLLRSLAEADMRADKTKLIIIPGVSFNERKEVA